jgi:RNA recognition motif-containing protein
MLESKQVVQNVSGQSKGYGLIEFAHNREKSEEARRKIDGQKLGSGSNTVRCQFVSDTIISFEQLHSRCLYITNIPADLNEAELKEVCSAVATPTHFQVS